MNVRDLRWSIWILSAVGAVFVVLAAYLLFFGELAGLALAVAIAGGCFAGAEALHAQEQVQVLATEVEVLRAAVLQLDAKALEQAGPTDDSR